MHFWVSYQHKHKRCINSKELLADIKEIETEAKAAVSSVSGSRVSGWTLAKRTPPTRPKQWTLGCGLNKTQNTNFLKPNNQTSGAPLHPTWKHQSQVRLRVLTQTFPNTPGDQHRCSGTKKSTDGWIFLLKCIQYMPDIRYKQTVTEVKEDKVRRTCCGSKPVWGWLP